MRRTTTLGKVLLLILLALLMSIGWLSIFSAIWTRIGPEGGAIVALAIDPQTPTTLYAGTYDGVFQSTDGGASWSAANNGLTNTDVQALAIDPQTPTTLYAVTWGGGVFKTKRLEHSVYLPLVLRNR
jgi:photosystem II stability/assembly factor-like uncharacterized protein